MEHFDIEKAPLEIERKFLIRYPDIEKLKEMPDYRCVHIEQTYLESDDDFAGGRIRRITEGATVTYIYTFKEKISDLTRYEFEKAITREEYLQLLSHKTPDTITIEKDRHSFSYAGLTYELDIYSFWQDRATLEAEVDSEDTPIPIPPCVELIEEVTFDRRYRNSQLSSNKGIIE